MLDFCENLRNMSDEFQLLVYSPPMNSSSNKGIGSIHYFPTCFITVLKVFILNITKC